MVLLVITRTALYTARMIMMVMLVVMFLMTMRTVITPMTILMFEVIRLILSGGDNEVDGDDAGDSENADDDVGDSDRNVLVIVAMTTMEAMNTMILTMAMVIGAVTECLLKTIMTMMVMVPAPEHDDDDGSGI